MIDETAITQAADYLWRSRDMIATEIKAAIAAHLKQPDLAAISPETKFSPKANEQPVERRDKWKRN